MRPLSKTHLRRRHRRISHLRLLALLTTIIGSIAAGCGPVSGSRAVSVTESGSLAPSDGSLLPTTEGSVGLPYDTPFIVEGIKQPATVAVADVDLSDDAQVIGVSVGERQRAYAIAALSGMSTHVVNDLIGDVPVSVTHCDQTACTRVFTSDQLGTPIDLWLGGWQEGELAVRYRDRHYAQSSRNVPLPDMPFTVTTWKEWREQHPDTDVFVGDVRTAGENDSHRRAARTAAE